MTKAYFPIASEDYKKLAETLDFLKHTSDIIKDQFEGIKSFDEYKAKIDAVAAGLTLLMEETLIQ